MIFADNLEKTYSVAPVNPFRRGARIPALAGATLRVGEGEAVALVGRNGAGKTTLLKILSTLVLPDGGRASVCGRDVAASPRAARAALGLVTGDERSLYWRLTGEQNLSLFGALYNIPPRELRPRVARALADFGLENHAAVPVRSYSSGLRQRLMLARALLHEPRVLLMDEPNRAADPILQGEFIARVRDEIAGRMNRSVLLATHNLEEAVSLGGDVAVIEKGRIVFFGRPAGVAELRELMAGFTSGNPNRRS